MLSKNQCINTYNIDTLRISLVRERSPLSSEVFSPQVAAQIASKLLGTDLDREVFAILILNVANKITAMHIVSIGTLTNTLVHPREVFKAAILSNAAGIILVHNHPSGDPKPSEDDRLITKRLYKAGKILGIDVLDHLVLGDEDRYYSFEEKDEYFGKYEV